MLVLAGGAGVGVAGGGASSGSLPRLVGSAANNTVVTAVGQTVYLYCGVTNLGDRQVRTGSFYMKTLKTVRVTSDVLK